MFCSPTPMTMSVPSKKRYLDSSNEMDVDIPEEHMLKKARQVDKLSNDMSQHLHLTSPRETHPPPPITKEENILVLLERLSKNKEMRENKQYMDNVANLLQQRFELSAKVESHRSCDNS